MSAIAVGFKNVALAFVLVLGFLMLLKGDAMTSPFSVIHASFGADVTDDRILVGSADFVFFGEVLSVHPGPELLSLPARDTSADAGESHELTGPSTLPQSLYVVRPMAALKGGGPGPLQESRVALMQPGGFGNSGELVLFEGDSLLSVGQVYLLFANFYSAVDRCDVGSSCPAELVPSTAPLTLIAPGYDHKSAPDSGAWLRLEQRFRDALDHQIDPRKRSP
jgi:hypothetical protein